ncbi:MAG: hypothetical protein WC878_02845 [Candidatus Paceibacterota bacterium]|jgi:hypothetical protein
MPQELNKIWNAGKLFEPKPESEQPAKQPESDPNPSTVKRKKSVIGAFMDTPLEDPFKEKVEAVLKGIEEVKPEPAEKAPDTENLESNGIVVVGPLEEEFYPKEFFSNDNKSAQLFVLNSFKNKILASARHVSEQPSTALSSYTLTKKMNDSEIRAELPKNHIFSQDDLWMIADLIKSDKVQHGYANLFYVEAGALVLVVYVGWDGSVWCVNAWDPDEYGQWFVGYRAFSRNG